MTARRTDWLELATKLIVLGVLVWPLLPDSRSRWFYTARVLRRLAAELGTAAMLAENRYYQALEEL